MGEKLVAAEAHIKDNPVVAKLDKRSQLAAKYFAENLVDFRNNYGEDLLMESRVKMMEEVSLAQGDLHKKIDHKMQKFDDKILSGKYKSLSSKILDANLLAGDREMTAKSVTNPAGEVLSYRLMLRADSYYEQLHDHHEYLHDTKTDHDNYHVLEHEYRDDITAHIR